LDAMAAESVRNDTRWEKLQESVELLHVKMEAQDNKLRAQDTAQQHMALTSQALSQFMKD
jgi:hypothetical protein